MQDHPMSQVATKATPIQRRQRARRAAPRCAVLVFVALLVSCGGGGGGGGGSGTATTEIVNGISVPLAPDAAQNDATPAGVDSNANNLRDDVERALAASAPSQAVYDGSVAVNVALQGLVVNAAPDRAAALALAKSVHCAIEAALQAGTTPTDAFDELLNTAERRNAFNANASLLGGVESDEFGDCV
jgi:hypothetical protein